MASLATDSLAYAFDRAARTIAAVLTGHNLDSALASLTLAPGTRPAVMDLAFSTLRLGGRGDFFLSQLMARPPADARIRALLLAALYRLENRPEDSHTTVYQAVAAAEDMARGRYKALVNGVLRNFIRRRAALTSQADAQETVRWQHPAWWLDKLRRTYPDRWQAIAAAGNTHPPMTLRLNTTRTTTTEFAERLAQAGIAAQALGGSAIRLTKPMPVDRLPGFAEGMVSIQDFGAQQAAGLLDARPGMRLLDACAAPGGKTAHLAEICRDLDLLALDIEPGRAARITENLQRLGLPGRVAVADCRDLDAWWDGKPFDRILADAPCSASGVVRRHPDIKWLRQSDDIAQFARLQAEIVDRLWRTLASGGKMLYATCSVFPEENDEQVQTFLGRHADAQRLPTHGDEYGWQLIPNDDQDGFYYAMLGKR